MTELIQTNILLWNDYETEILTEKNLKNFLMKEAIPCLSCRFKEPEHFYKNILFKILKDKKNKSPKKFKMIYSHLVQFYPHDYLTKEELIEKHHITENSILAEGSVTLHDTSLKNKPLVRWLITID